MTGIGNCEHKGKWGGWENVLYSLQKRRIPRRKEVEEWRTRVMGYEEVR